MFVCQALVISFSVKWDHYISRQLTFQRKVNNIALFWEIIQYMWHSSDFRFRRTVCPSRMTGKIFLDENINLTNFDQFGLGTKLVALSTVNSIRQVKHLLNNYQQFDHIQCDTRWWLAQCSKPKPAAAWMGSLWIAGCNFCCRWPRHQHNLHFVHVRQFLINLWQCGLKDLMTAICFFRSIPSNETCMTNLADYFVVQINFMSLWHLTTI